MQAGAVGRKVEGDRARTADHCVSSSGPADGPLPAQPERGVRPIR